MKRCLLTLVAIAALAGHARAAAKSVTLIGIGGALGERISDQLEEGLSDLYQVVPAEVYLRTAQKMELSGTSVEVVQVVASRLRIDALIEGAITGDARARQLTITVHAGANGRVIARGRYDLAGRAVQAVCDRVLADLVRALEHVNTAPLQARKPTPPRAPEPASDDDDDDSAPPAARPASRPAPAPVSTDDEG